MVTKGGEGVEVTVLRQLFDSLPSLWWTNHALENTAWLISGLYTKVVCYHINPNNNLYPDYHLKLRVTIHISIQYSCCNFLLTFLHWQQDSIYRRKINLLKKTHIQNFNHSIKENSFIKCKMHFMHKSMKISSKIHLKY